MKVWTGYGTEHSMRLVMIGHFTDAKAAKDSKAEIERLTEQVRKDVEDGAMRLGWDEPSRFSDGMLELLRELNLPPLGPTDVENFAYDYSAALVGSDLTIETDEIDVSAFMKIMLQHGAIVEVYSGHNHEHGLVAPGD